MATNIVIVEGNLTRDLELRLAQSGIAVVGGAVAFNTRVRNKETGEWEDGEPSFFDFVIFGEHGEHVADSLGKGDRVIVTGRLQQDRWQDKESGDNRSKVKIVAESVSPVLRWATAEVTKQASSAGGNGGSPFEGVELTEV